MTSWDVTLGGLKVRTELPLPEVPVWHGAQDVPPDVVIRRGAVPCPLPDIVAAGPLVTLSRDGAWCLGLPGVGRFLVPDGGSEIIVAPDVPPEAPDLRVFLLTACLEALLERRGRLVLSGAVAEIDGQAIVLPSKAACGRSNLIAALLARGHRFLSGEACVLGEDGAQAEPTHPDLVVTGDLVEALAGPGSGLQRVRRDVDRYHWPRPDRFVAKSRPIAAVVLPSDTDGLQEPGLRPLSGAVAVSRLVEAGRRHGLRHRPAAGHALLHWAGRMAAAGRVWSLAVASGDPVLAGAAADIEGCLVEGSP